MSNKRDPSVLVAVGCVVLLAPHLDFSIFPRPWDLSPCPCTHEDAVKRLDDPGFHVAIEPVDAREFYNEKIIARHLPILYPSHRPLRLANYRRCSKYSTFSSCQFRPSSGGCGKLPNGAIL